MAKRYFNWKLATVILIAIIVLTVTVFGLRQWQKGSRSQNLLEVGEKAYDEHNWQEAARNLAKELAGFFKIYMIQLPIDKDPGDLDYDYMVKLRREAKPFNEIALERKII